MPRHRTFTLGAPPTDEDHVTFDLTGQYTTRPEETWMETFTCYGMAPGAVLEDLSQAIGIDQTTGRRRYSSVSCMSFVASVLIPEDRDRFSELLHDTERMVGLLDLVQVVVWLSDELTLRPTRPSSASMPGGERRDGAATPVVAVT